MHVCACRQHIAADTSFCPSRPLCYPCAFLMCLGFVCLHPHCACIARFFVTVIRCGAWSGTLWAACCRRQGMTAACCCGSKIYWYGGCSCFSSISWPPGDSWSPKCLPCSVLCLHCSQGNWQRIQELAAPLPAAESGAPGRMAPTDAMRAGPADA
jgi:hypothetical protein